MRKSIPMGRIGEPDDVSRAATWICSDEAIGSAARRWRSTARSGCTAARSNFREAYDSVAKRRCSVVSIDFSHAPHAWEKERAISSLARLAARSVDHGKAVMRMPYRAEITNGTGAVHGGAIVSLCDTVFYVALASIYGRDQETTTVSLQCNFLAPALPPHDLVAEARSCAPDGASATARSTCAAATRSSRTPRSISSTRIPKRSRRAKRLAGVSRTAKDDEDTTRCGAPRSTTSTAQARRAHGSVRRLRDAGAVRRHSQGARRRASSRRTLRSLAHGTVRA